MKKLFYAALCISVLSCQSTPSTHNSPDTPAPVNTQPPAVPVPTESAGPVASAAPDSLPATPAAQAPETAHPASPALRTGAYPITLQWISWDHPGTAQVKQQDDGFYRIDGRQQRKGDYLEIHGRLKPLSETTLSFEGTITTRVSHVNGGKPCVKKGPQTFKATKGRKYWRLQDMINCEGGQVTDYIDIYF